MDKVNVAAIGESSSIMIFHAAGICTQPATNPEEAERALHELSNEGFRVIFITESLAEQIPEAINRYRTESFPAIIPIPNRTGSTGYGLKRITDNMEKAIGTNIFEK